MLHKLYCSTFTVIPGPWACPFLKKKAFLLLFPLLVRGLISRWLHVLSWQKNVRLSTQEGTWLLLLPFFAHKFGNQIQVWKHAKYLVKQIGPLTPKQPSTQPYPNFLKNFHHHDTLDKSKANLNAQIATSTKHWNLTILTYPYGSN